MKQATPNQRSSKPFTVMNQRDKKKVIDNTQIHMFDDNLSPPETVDNSPMQNKRFLEFDIRSPKNGLGPLDIEFSNLDTVLRAYR